MLSVSVADDQDAEPVVMNRLNGGEWRPYIGEQKVPLREGDNLIEVTARDAAGNVGSSESTITSEQDLSVGGASWLILVVILVVVAGLMGVWYWRAQQQPGEED
jgi:hypothetical protein